MTDTTNELKKYKFISKHQASVINTLQNEICSFHNRLNDATTEVERLRITNEWLLNEVDRLRTENETMRDRITEARAVLFIK